MNGNSSPRSVVEKFHSEMAAIGSRREEEDFFSEIYVSRHFKNRNVRSWAAMTRWWDLISTHTGWVLHINLLDGMQTEREGESEEENYTSNELSLTASIDDCIMAYCFGMTILFLFGIFCQPRDCWCFCNVFATSVTIYWIYWYIRAAWHRQCQAVDIGFVCTEDGIITPQRIT